MCFPTSMLSSASFCRSIIVSVILGEIVPGIDHFTSCDVGPEQETHRDTCRDRHTHVQRDTQAHTETQTDRKKGGTEIASSDQDLRIPEPRSWWRAKSPQESILTVSLNCFRVMPTAAATHCTGSWSHRHSVADVKREGGRGCQSNLPVSVKLRASRRQDARREKAGR